MKPRRILQWVQMIVIMMWPPVLWAAPMAFEQSFNDVPMVAWIGVALLSTLGGITALLIRVSAQVNGTPEGQDPKPIRNAWLLVAAHMSGSWFTGVVVFLFGLHSNVPFFLLAGGVGACSFVGAKIIEAIADKYLSVKILPKE